MNQATNQSRHMCLGLVINRAGGHVASWKHPAVPPGAAMSFDYYRRIAALAEQARFDLLFLADHLSVGEASATAERLQKSGEVVKALWDSWDDDAFCHDKERGSSGPKLLQEKAKRENLTLRQLAFEVEGARRHRLVIGSATQVAAQLELWFRNEAADRFNIFPAWMPGGVEDFAELVIPELQRRGLYRTEYEGRTLRENLGLARPPNRHTGSAAASASR